MTHYKKIGYNINALRQIACLVVDQIMVGNFAFLLNCMLSGQTSDSLMNQLQNLSIDERVGALCCVCGWAHWWLTVGFLLLRYSVVCTVESLSLFDLLFVSRFVSTNR